MLLKTHNFEFGEFCLETKEKLLLRAGKPLSITPKTFKLLSVLLENHGRLVEKDTLMKAVWADSYVEEGNLAFTVRLLRKVLGDDSQNPRFIETVPRRGYRFIADVKIVRLDNETVEQTETASRAIEKKSSRPKSGNHLFSFAVVAIAFCSILALGVWYARSADSSSEMPVLNAPFASEKLSTNGKVGIAVITPDGQNVIYRNIGGDGRQSIWLRQTETGSNVEIIPPSDEIYYGLTTSPDGKWLYFTRRPRQEERQPDIYRVSIFGGVPQKIISESQGWSSISPDGAKISFVRCPYRDDEFCSLWIADSADGKNERKLAARPRPFRISDNRISPDGKTIAFAVGQSENAANEFSLMEIDTASGAEREFTKEKFFNIKSLAWLPDQSGLLITASRTPNRNFLIWHVAAGSGKTKSLTKDSETYSALSLDTNARAVVATQVKQDFHLQIFQLAEPTANRTLINASEAGFAPDGSIVFSSQMSGNNEIWSINADGANQRQLTNNAADESAPIASPDNNYIYFSSNRSGAAQVWRMNTDGSNQTQITKTEGGFPLFVSPDGAWIYYHHGITRTLWRVSAQTGEEQIVFNQKKFLFAVSPDGKQFAFVERTGTARALSIALTENGTIVKKFPPLENKTYFLDFVWMPDGKSLLYISSDGEFGSNILWNQPLDRETPRRITTLKKEEMNECVDLSVAPDGKSFAVVQGRWLHDAVLLKGLN